MFFFNVTFFSLQRVRYRKNAMMGMQKGLAKITFLTIFHQTNHPKNPFRIGLRYNVNIVLVHAYTYTRYASSLLFHKTMSRNYYKKIETRLYFRHLRSTLKRDVAIPSSQPEMFRITRASAPWSVLPMLQSRNCRTKTQMA